jgi:ABC-type transporter Mla subunit MlaD
MCLNCGCGEPEDDHGDERNITLDDLHAASQATGQDLHETIDHMERALDQVESEQRFN